MSDTKHKILYLGVRAPRVPIRDDSGVELFHHPTIRIQYRANIDSEQLKMLFDEDCYFVFLSRNGVVGLDSWIQTIEHNFNFKEKRVWGVGTQTAREVKSVFGVVAEEPHDQNAKGLIEVFKALKPRAVVLFSAEEPRPEFPEWLKANGWNYYMFPVYETITVQNQDLANRFCNCTDESIVFTAPSTVRGFLESIGRSDLRNISSRLFSIGPSTSKEVTALGGGVYQEATEPDIDQLLTNIIIEMDK